MTLPPRVSDLIPFDLLLSVARLGSLGQAAAALDAGVTALRREQESRLRVAASLTVAEYLLPAWLTTLRSADAGTAVALTAVNSADVAEAVLSGGADLGFVEGPDLPDGLRATIVSRDELTVVVAPAHPWARRRSGITAAELAGTGPAVLSSLAVAGELTAGTLRAVPVRGLDLHRALRAVWPAGRRLTGPTQDLYLIATRSVRPG